MSDMLEMLMKRMDILARLENSTDFHKGDEARFSLDRSVRPCGAALGVGGFAGAEHSDVLSCSGRVVGPKGLWGLGSDAVLHHNDIRL